MRIATQPFIEHDITPPKFDARQTASAPTPSPRVPPGLPPRHPGLSTAIETQPTSFPPRSTSPFARKTPLDSLKVADNGCVSSSLNSKKSSPNSSPASSVQDSSSSGHSRQHLAAFQVAQANLNQQDICTGLSIEWLLLKGQGNATNRLATLQPGSAAHHAASEKHDIYLAAIAQAHKTGATHPLNEGANAVLSVAGLKKLGDSIPVFFETAEDIATVAKNLTQNNARFLLSLRFANGQGHAIAATNNAGHTRLFDPNLGEFEASSNDTTKLLKQLAAHYGSMDFDLVGINLHQIH